MPDLELIHEDLPALLDEVIRRNGWSWEKLYRGEISIEGQPLTLDALQWDVINNDPVLWAETNLVNRLEDGGGLWRLFDYQKPSLRFRGHVVHMDGAEVGKSREIVALALWTCTGEERGSCLVGSALDGDLDELWEEIEWNLTSNPFLDSLVAKKTTKPYRRLKFKNGLHVNFRPAGHDGRAYRGVHVRGLLFHDESAKVTNAVSWSEFWRAAKPGCKARLYSVPTGDRLCVYQRIADGAIPFEKVDPGAPTPAQIVDLIIRGNSMPPGARALSRELGGRVWVRFYWPKTIMPHPFWSEERREEYLDMYGSEDAPGYVHNVLGLPGDPEFSVFPSRLLDPALRFIQEYRTVELRWDGRNNRLEVKVKRLNPAYEEATDPPDQEADSEAEEEGGNAVEAMLQVFRDSRDISGFHAWPAEDRRTFLVDVVRCCVPPVDGFLTGGIDLASSTVTEINFERSERGRDRWILRVSLKGFDYHAQRDVIRALDEVLQPAGGWGLDATGVGKVLLDLLNGDGELAGRLSGFVFNQAVPAVNPETGECQTDPQTGREMFISIKEQGTQLLERDLSARTKEVPRDPELVFLLNNHRFTEPKGVRIFIKQNDHVADSWRCLALRRLATLYGVAVEVPVTYAVPSDNAIDSMTIMKSF